MLRLSRISLTHFKNYEFESFGFTSRVTGICGLNGKGKTNLLDAIFYCCFTKSYFTSSDQLNVCFGKDGFRLEGHFANEQDELKVVCINRGTGKKEFYLNDVQYEKLSKHIGLLPTVMIAPDDIEIITGGSEERRKLIDAIICQLDAVYLQQLMIYNKVLQQRNGLLKQFAEKGKTEETLLQILDDQLIPPGNYVFERRKKFTAQLIPLVQDFYKQIAENEEQIHISYESKLFSQSFDQLLTQNRDKDRFSQRTNAGIHKDDIVFELNGQPFKSIASQGQRKSLLFAIKLAEYEVMRMGKGFAPLLLLDDVFEKLDDNRMKNLLNWVCNQNEGQVFITDTHRERLEKAFEQLNVDGQIIEL
ncbi:MAG: DNA replication and repair protein RecF [Sphingobacteriales bacterium]|nr:MAG: DNA replication and repair protein RecF [Sphingobacteriales bacterium]